MSVNWNHEGERVYFEMMAPTNGWITIGFNDSSGIENTYLLMGHVVNGVAEVVEHFTISAGNYKPITELGSEARVAHVSGEDRGIHTKINFSIPKKSFSIHQKGLVEGKMYYMLMAFSREDDFQHHSIMRTSVQVTL